MLTANVCAASKGQDLAVLIGNSRKLWQPFLSQWQCSKELQASSNPLEEYLTSHLVNFMNAEFGG